MPVRPSKMLMRNSLISSGLEPVERIDSRVSSETN